MTRKSRAWVLAVSMMLSVFLAGCPVLWTAGGVISATAYVLGELRSDVDGSPKAVVEATTKAMEEMMWTTEIVRSSDEDGYIRAMTDDGEVVNVEIKRRSYAVSKIGIRIGFMGDQETSRALLEQIEKQLEDGGVDERAPRLIENGNT
ncbi:MAG: DUF3568 family protein [Desulfobacterales bacterium]